MRFSGTGSRNSETLSDQQLQPWPECDHKAQHWGLAGCGSTCSLIPVSPSLECVSMRPEHSHTSHTKFDKLGCPVNIRSWTDLFDGEFFVWLGEEKELRPDFILLESRHSVAFNLYLTLAECFVNANESGWLPFSQLKTLGAFGNSQFVVVLRNKAKLNSRIIQWFYFIQILFPIKLKFVPRLLGSRNWIFFLLFLSTLY